MYCFFVKQKTAYELRIIDWSSYVCSSDLHVADPKRAAVDEHRRDRPATLVELGLDHDAFGVAVRVGLEFEQLGLELDLLDQVVEPGLLERRHLDILDVARHHLDEIGRAHA